MILKEDGNIRRDAQRKGRAYMNFWGSIVRTLNLL